jgi:predicted kinase
MHAIVLCGIQASGKSSLVRRNWYDSHVRLNQDMLRTRQREDILLHACLAMQAPFVADNTNVTRSRRLRYLQLARAAGYASVELYFFPIGLDAALERNARRSGAQRVPDLALRGTFAKLEAPTPDEGWDRMYQVQLHDDFGLLVRRQLRDAQLTD